jgi:hypothetical protein
LRGEVSPGFEPRQTRHRPKWTSAESQGWPSPAVANPQLPSRAKPFVVTESFRGISSRDAGRQSGAQAPTCQNVTAHGGSAKRESSAGEALTQGRKGRGPWLRAIFRRKGRPTPHRFFIHFRKHSKLYQGFSFRSTNFHELSDSILGLIRSSVSGSVNVI